MTEKERVKEEKKTEKKKDEQAKEKPVEKKEENKINTSVEKKSIEDTIEEETEEEEEPRNKILDQISTKQIKIEDALADEERREKIDPDHPYGNILKNSKYDTQKYGEDIKKNNEKEDFSRRSISQGIYEVQSVDNGMNSWGRTETQDQGYDTRPINDLEDHTKRRRRL